MKYIIEENCTDVEGKKKLLEKCKIVLNRMFEELQLDTLDYFAVGSSDPALFAQSIQKYARILHKEVAIIDDKDYQVAAKTICSLDPKGKIHQVLLIKDGLLIGFLNDILVFEGQEPINIPNYNTMKFISFITIMHEIGHINNGQNLNSLGLSKANKILFDLYDELDEYAFGAGRSLLDEYFAEKFAWISVSDFRNMLDSYVNQKEDILIECIRTYSHGELLNQKVERIYRILYFFVHYIANFHSNNTPVPFYEQYKNDELIKEYLPLFKVFENSIQKIESEYPHVNEEDIQQLKNDFMDFVTYECEKI